MDLLQTEKKTSPVMKKLYVGLFLFLLYAGYCIGTLGKEGLALEGLRMRIFLSLFHPVPFRVTEVTGVAMLIMALAGLFILMKMQGDQRNYMPGIEYGSARIAKPAEVNAVLEDPDPHNNKIISEHIRISMNTRQTGLNNNMVVIGGSGAGKSFYMVKPNGFNCASSFVFTDPKAELLRDLGNYLKSVGYTIRVLNLIDMDASDCYNPFDYITSDEDIEKLITNLIANTTPKNASSGDPFWEKSESMLLQALMQYVWRECPRMGRRANFKELLDLLNKARISEDERSKSELDELMEELAEDHPARVAYNKVMVGAADTKRSIIISAQSRLNRLQNPKVLRILDYDEIDIPSLGEGIYENPENKVALFLVIPDNDKTYNFLVGLAYTQIFQQLYYIADNKHQGKLPIHVALWMDEFANVSLPDSFCEILSTMRSREISCNIIIQSQAQLKTLFKDSWETIMGNADTLVYLGGNEQSSHKYVSEMMGKHTIDKKSSGETLGSHGSSSRNYDVIGRDWMDAAEVRKFDNKKCAVFIRGFDTVIDDKYHTPEKDEFKTAVNLGPYTHIKKKTGEEDLSKMNFYLNSYCRDRYGSNVPEVYNSYRSQIHRYGFICEETDEYKDMAKDKNGKYLALPMKAAMYHVDGSVICYAPLFDARSEILKSGPHVFHIHRIIGRWTERDVDGVPELFKDPEEEWRKHFNEMLLIKV